MKTLISILFVTSTFSAFAFDCGFDRMNGLYKTTSEYVDLVERKLDVMWASTPGLYLYEDLAETQKYLNRAAAALEDKCGPKRLTAKVNHARNRVRDFENALHLDIGEATDAHYIKINLEIGEAIIK